MRGPSEQQVLSALAEHYAAGHLHTGTYELRVAAALGAAPAEDVTWDLPAAVDRLRDRLHPSPPCARLYVAAPDLEHLDLCAGPRTWSIGRASSNDVVLRDPAISRRHALLSTRGGRCTVRDLGSRNGVRVNGRPVRCTRLRPGDVVVFGEAVRAEVR